MGNDNWSLDNRPELGLMNSVNGLMRRLEASDTASFPDLRRASRILVGSDYSGQHKTSRYEAVAVLLADTEGCERWLTLRGLVRDRMPRDRRRFSYKGLGDRRLAAVLPDFLEAANLIPGLLAVLLVDKSIGSLFKQSGRIQSSDPGVETLAHWPPRVTERLLRVCHFVSFFVAGLSREGQDVLWITDEDEIAANPTRHTELVEVFARISSHYLPHPLRHLRIATTASDTGERDLEDFVSIADFSAGAVCAALNAYRYSGILLPTRIIVQPAREIPRKASQLLSWFSEGGTALKRLVLVLENEEGTVRLRVRRYTFHGSSELLSP